ncbi:MAG: N-acetylmuramoyl-L-alanine amidase [Acidimicrobiia bacterium]
MALAPHLLARLVEAPVPLGPTRLATTTLGAPPVIARAAWGADETIGTRTRFFAPLRKAIVHHTAVDSPDPYGDPEGQLRAVQRAHVNNGWADIGYQFAVAPDGRIFEGRYARPFGPGEVPSGEDANGNLVIGAHAENHNTGSLGVVLLGDLSGRDPTPEALNAAARVIAWKFRPRGIGAYGSAPYTRVGDGVTVVFPDVCGHRDVKATACPGSLYDHLPDLRDRVHALSTAGLVGFRVLGADGSLQNAEVAPGFAATQDIGDPRRNVRAGLPVQALAGTPTGDGAWVADEGGSVYCFGDAPFHGSLGGRRLNRPIVGMAPTPSGGGYWLVASDGGVFAFGDARFHGSTGAIALNQPIVGMASTPSGGGYWLVASDGGVFAFGDAGYFGSTGAIRLQQPVTSMAAAPDGRGYWLVARDGGVFCFGSAAFFGSGVGRWLFSAPAAGLVPTGGAGYWLLDAAGGIHPCGDAVGVRSGIPPSARPARAFVPVVRA